MKQSIAKRLERIDTRLKPVTYHAPDPEEIRKGGQWIANTIDRTCGPRPKRTPDNSGVIMNNELMCSCGHAPLWCKTFFVNILARAEIEKDEDEKRELLEFHAWWIRGVAHDDNTKKN
ncbi:MAG: hypothetical protein ACXV7G_12090 [Halobacteriota archaeon]